MCNRHLTAGIMSSTALFRALCVKGGTHPLLPIPCGTCWPSASIPSPRGMRTPMTPIASAMTPCSNSEWSGLPWTQHTTEPAPPRSPVWSTTSTAKTFIGSRAPWWPTASPATPSRMSVACHGERLPSARSVQSAGRSPAAGGLQSLTTRLPHRNRHGWSGRRWEESRVVLGYNGPSANLVWFLRNGCRTHTILSKTYTRFVLF